MLCAFLLLRLVDLAVVSLARLLLLLQLALVAGRLRLRLVGGCVVVAAGCTWQFPLLSSFSSAATCHDA